MSGFPAITPDVIGSIVIGMLGLIIGLLGLIYHRIDRRIEGIEVVMFKEVERLSDVRHDDRDQITTLGGRITIAEYEIKTLKEKFSLLEKMA